MVGVGEKEERGNAMIGEVLLKIVLGYPPETSFHIWLLNKSAKALSDNPILMFNVQ